jgi:hypothetical protein
VYMVETHRKRDMSGWHGFIIKMAGTVVSWPTNCPSMAHVHFWTSVFGDESSSAMYSNTFASTAACAP